MSVSAPSGRMDPRVSLLIEGTKVLLEATERELGQCKISNSVIRGNVLFAGTPGSLGAVDHEATLETIVKIQELNTVFEFTKINFRSLFRDHFKHDLIRPINDRLARMTTLFESTLFEHQQFAERQKTAALHALNTRNFNLYDAQPA